MKVVENENAVKIIKALIPESILKLNPVIAGGFVVSLYHLAMRYSSPIYDADLAVKIERANNNQVWITSSNRMLADLNIEKKFGDIDFWFLKDNEIWQENHLARFLIKDFISDVEEDYIKLIGTPPTYLWGPVVSGGVVGGGVSVTAPVSVIGLPQGGQSQATIIISGGGGGGGGMNMPLKASGRAGRRKTFKNEVKNYPNVFAQFGLAEEIDNSSYWANTFTTDARSSWAGKTAKIVDNLKIQIVKKAYETIDELFTKFDMLNCCAAYYDGKFYFHDDFEHCSNTHILEAGDSFFKPTTLGKIWSANRSFKYAKRFDLEFSQEVTESITETFIESEILLEKIKGLNDSDLIDLGSVEEINDPYGKNGTVSVQKLNGMIMNLFNSGPALFSMKQFDKNNLFVFMNSRHQVIKRFIRQYIEKESEDFRKAQELEPRQDNQILSSPKISIDEDTDELFSW